MPPMRNPQITGGRPAPRPGRPPALTTHHGGPHTRRSWVLVDELMPFVPPIYLPVVGFAPDGRTRPVELTQRIRARRRARRLAALRRVVRFSGRLVLAVGLGVLMALYAGCDSGQGTSDPAETVSVPTPRSAP